MKYFGYTWQVNAASIQNVGSLKKEIHFLGNFKKKFITFMLSFSKIPKVQDSAGAFKLNGAASST
jgi:hypothetical protein